jgi:hypothetical protein
MATRGCQAIAVPAYFPTRAPISPCLSSSAQPPTLNASRTSHCVRRREHRGEGRRDALEEPREDEDGARDPQQEDLRMSRLRRDEDRADIVGVRAA